MRGEAYLLQEKLTTKIQTWFKRKIGYRFLSFIVIIAFLFYGFIYMMTEIIVGHHGFNYLLNYPYKPYYLNPLFVFILSVICLFMYFCVCMGKRMVKEA